MFFHVILTTGKKSTNIHTKMYYQDSKNVARILILFVCISINVLITLNSCT